MPSLCRVDGEMSSAEVCAKISSESADAELEAAGGQFFLDGDTGRYYYQTADGDVMVLASKQVRGISQVWYP